MTYDFGLVGLGVMGRNFILNVADNEFAAYGLDTDPEKVEALRKEGAGKKVDGTTDKAEFVKSLSTPRKIMMLVPAGGPVDSVINDLLPHLDEGDLLIDGGNSFYTDTDRRFEQLKEKGIHFMGCGVSGGAKGARFGPSMMPGGSEESYEVVRPVFEAAAAKVGDDPCVAYLGKGSAGNYVKMVHNGIEYGMMQLIIEKPFGYSLATARELNKELRECFEEGQIYRIDHYLGKETVQNLFVTRFSNSIFEPLWNRNYIHRIEITSAESVGVEKRGGYYDGSGALRDMVQNHLLQLVSLVAMEPPVRVDADGIRNEKLKLFQSLRPMTAEDIRTNVIRGQYTTSKIRGEEVPGYREEDGVDPNSKTETFVAMKFFVDNWRWADVPFYIRSGKRLPTRVSEVVIHFKPNHLHLFEKSEAPNSQNMLVLRIQPDEGILMKIGLKIPGAGYHVKNVNLDFLYSSLTDAYVPDAYERLIMDAMQGDATLYARGDSAEAAWAFIDPILEAWKSDPDIPVYGYPAGTWGPAHVDELIDGENMIWRYPCKNLTDDGEYCEL